MNELTNFFGEYKEIVLGLMIVSAVTLIISIVLIVKDKKKLNEIEENEEDDKNIDNESTNTVKDLLDKMQNDLDDKVDTSSFEEEQEGKSIISYQELLKAVNDKKNPEIEKATEEVNETVKSAYVNKIKDGSKFQNTDFISPIYGLQESKLEYPKVKQFNLEEPLMTKEVKVKETAKLFLDESQDELVWAKNNKNEEFLISLKEFRKNLD